MADLFHEELELGRIAAVFGVMAATPRHTYQVLTKRASRMADFFGWLELQSERTRKTVPQLLAEHTATELGQMVPMATEWPLSNVWLGVSIEDQRRLEERLPYLMDTPAAVRFLSCEPLLGPLDCHNETNAGGEDYDWLTGENYQWRDGSPERLPLRPSLDWIIAGGESGAGARPSHPAWFRKLRDDATEAGVAFFFKQWGAWAPRRPAILTTAIEERIITDAGGGDVLMRCVGKTKAGRELDGRTWEEMPATMDDTVNEEEDKDGKT
jgi:protein gp37